MINNMEIEGIFAMVVLIGCFILIAKGMNGSLKAVISLLIGRFLGKQESKKRNGR